jgi:GNAT superfamily N-acetyltransferase
VNTTYEFSFNHVCVARARVDLTTHELAELWVCPDHRHRGLGRRMMKLVCDEADREGVQLKLMAAGSEAMSTEQLETWYARFGFVRLPDVFMYRKPRIR